MCWEEFTAQWEEQKYRITKRWRLLTDDDLGQIQGEWERLAAKIMARYGLTIQTAEKQIFDLLCSIEPAELKWEEARKVASHR